MLEFADNQVFRNGLQARITHSLFTACITRTWLLKARAGTAKNATDGSLVWLSPIVRASDGLENTWVLKAKPIAEFPNQYVVVCSAVATT